MHVKFALTHTLLALLILCDSLSVSQVVCQLGDLVCDCSVIYFLDKCGTMCIAVAARVITSVTAVSIGGCVVCWPWTFTLQILFLGFFNGGGVLRMLPRMRFFLEQCWTSNVSLQTAWSTVTDCNNDTRLEGHLQ